MWPGGIGEIGWTKNWICFAIDRVKVNERSGRPDRYSMPVDLQVGYNGIDVLSVNLANARYLLLEGDECPGGICIGQ